METLRFIALRCLWLDAETSSAWPQIKEQNFSFRVTLNSIQGLNTSSCFVYFDHQNIKSQGDVCFDCNASSPHSIHPSTWAKSLMINTLQIERHSRVLLFSLIIQKEDVGRLKNLSPSGLFSPWIPSLWTLQFERLLLHSQLEILRFVALRSGWRLLFDFQFLHLPLSILTANVLQPKKSLMACSHFQHGRTKMKTNRKMPWKTFIKRITRHAYVL